MRKCIFAAVIVSIVSLTAAAQEYNIGIKVGPTLSYSNPSTDGDTNFNSNGVSVKFLLGGFVDYKFQENYYFSFGVNYASKNVDIEARSTQSISTRLGYSQFDQEFIQVPLLLKLYTNEVILDTKVYFNFGFIPEIRISSDGNPDNDDMIREFKSYDLAGNFGGGLERSIGVNTRVFAGLSYNLGFINQIKSQNPAFDEFTLKNRLFALEIGIKF